MSLKIPKFIDNALAKVKDKQRILVIDGDDQRAVEAAKFLANHPKVEVTLLVQDGEPTVSGVNYININSDVNQYNDFVEQLYAFRKGKDEREALGKLLKQKPYYAMMLLKSGVVDGVVGGLAYTTADILRAVFKAIGPKPGVKTISSLMMMVKGDEILAFSDISINVNPSAEQLAEIAANAYEYMKDYLDVKPAFLSFSTQGSAVTDESKKVVEAKRVFSEKYPNVKALGEIQFDAAYDPNTLAKKYKNPEFNEKANLFIFPDLGAGNIGYKIAQRMGGYAAFGPIVTGSALPVNDLSRGATAEDVVNTILGTAISAGASNE